MSIQLLSVLINFKFSPGLDQGVEPKRVDRAGFPSAYEIADFMGPFSLLVLVTYYVRSP